MSLSAILGHRVMFSECWTRDLLHEPPAGALAAASPRTRFNNSRGGAFVDSRSARNGVPARGPAAHPRCGQLGAAPAFLALYIVNGRCVPHVTIRVCRTGAIGLRFAMPPRSRYGRYQLKRISVWMS